MKVWILLKGEQGEGGYVANVYSTYKMARNAALSFRDFAYVDKYLPEEVSPDYWECCFEFLCIREFDVV